jgi:PAS domain S-box-containing protein
MRRIEDIRAEIVAATGFVPPALDVVRDDPAVLEALWQVTRSGYVCNPLPQPFKEKFLLLMARAHRCALSLTLRCCHVYERGVPPAEVLDLARDSMPPVAKLLSDIKAATARGGKAAEWAQPGSAIERAVLWAAVRMTQHRDRRGRCREALQSLMGDRLLDNLILLGAYAAHERVWAESRSFMPGAEAPGQEPFLRNRARLLAEAPEIEKVWQAHETARRRRAVGSRERSLLAELASQDRIRAAVEASEQRFRAVVQSSPLPMMVYAEDGQVILVNRAWSEISGWRAADVPTVEIWRARAESDDKIAMADDGSNVAQEVEALFENDEPIEEGEIAIRTRRNGQRVWDMSSVAIGKLPDGRRAVLRIGADVTARHTLEESLWESNRRMTRILESISDGFISLDLQWHFVFINGEGERILGQTRDQLVGTPIYRFASWARDGSLFGKLETAAKEGRVLHEEHFNTRLGRWIRYRAYPSEEGVSLFFEDVTEEKRIHEALAESEQRLRQIAANTHEVFWMTDAVTHEVLYISPSYEAIWGKCVSEPGNQAMAWLKSVHKADMAATLEAIERQSRGESVEYEFRLVRPDGALRWLRARANPIKDAEGVTRRVAGICQDITAQREAEAAMRASQRILRQVADSLGPMVFMIADDGLQLLYVSKGVEKIWGYSQKKALAMASRWPWHAAVVKEDRQRVTEVLASLAADGGDATVICRIRRKDGTIRSLRSRASAIHQEGGTTHRIVGIAVDVTDQMQLSFLS